MIPVFIVTRQWAIQTIFLCAISIFSHQWYKISKIMCPKSTFSIFLLKRCPSVLQKGLIRPGLITVQESIWLRVDMSCCLTFFELIFFFFVYFHPLLNNRAVTHMLKIFESGQNSNRFQDHCFEFYLLCYTKIWSVTVLV